MQTNKKEKKTTNRIESNAFNELLENHKFYLKHLNNARNTLSGKQAGKQNSFNLKQ